MPHSTLSKFQIGKNGLTEGVINSLQQDLKHHKQVRIAVLKSACRDKTELEKMAMEMSTRLTKVKYKIIGYTIILIKQTKK